MYDKVLRYNIDRERKGIAYITSEQDKIVLEKMTKEINEHCGTNIHYLAEIDFYCIHNSGEIMAQYLNRFQSESVRGFLIPQIVADKIEDCDKIVLQSYLHFKDSDEYISGPNEPAPAHIYVRYDNAFRKLKPKRLKTDLLLLAHNPRDAFYLPFTMRMLASWKIPEMETVLISYYDSNNITEKSVDLPEMTENCFPPLSFIRRELRFTAIDGLKYYPSERTIGMIRKCIDEPDKDVSSAAKKALAYIEKHSTKSFKDAKKNENYVD